MFWAILSLIFVVYYGLYLVYHAVLFSRYRPQRTNELRFVSVIIPIRNEAKYLAECIEGILSQDYPVTHYEVIMVDDHSEDGSQEIIKEYEALGVKYLRLEEGIYGKKAALQKGIAESQGEIIMTTDGDTKRGSGWLRSMVSYFQEGVGMVSGPVRLTGTSAFEEMQALEFAGLIALGAGMIAAQSPSLCNGANLAYLHSAFKAVNGFENIDHIASGDDELLLHKIHRQTKYKIVFAKTTEAIVSTPAQPSLKVFLFQRLRWVSKSTLYPNRWITFNLIMAYSANLAIIISLFSDLRWFGLLIAVKIICEGYILLKATHFLQQKQIARWLVIEQFLHIAYVLWIGIYAQIRKQYIWKGRKVK